MFIDELTPVFKQFIQHPLSFTGGFFSGLLRLNLADEPVKSWLDQQRRSNNHTAFITDANNGTGGPQSIAIE